MNRDKIVKGLEDVNTYFHHMTEICYHGDEPGYCELQEKVTDALELLKEQEGKVERIAEWLSGYAAPPNVRSPLALYGDLKAAWEAALKDV